LNLGKCPKNKMGTHTYLLLFLNYLHRARRHGVADACREANSVKGLPQNAASIS
jgi:hypothetical protein